jgi:hypothetical protein
VSIPHNIEMLIPWRIIEDSPDIKNRAQRLSDELESEVPPKHVLHGLEAKAVATRIDRDDVLFEIEGGQMPLAVVHMTWRKETDPMQESRKAQDNGERYALRSAHNAAGAVAKRRGHQ